MLRAMNKIPEQMSKLSAKDNKIKFNSSELNSNNSNLQRTKIKIKSGNSKKSFIITNKKNKDASKSCKTHYLISIKQKISLISSTKANKSSLYAGKNTNKKLHNLEIKTPSLERRLKINIH